VLCVLNTGAMPVALPAGTVIAASTPVSGDALQPDSAAWVMTG
jgi:hypothetical protein